jgi:hypothetical protein
MSDQEDPIEAERRIRQWELREEEEARRLALEEAEEEKPVKLGEWGKGGSGVFLSRNYVDSMIQPFFDHPLDPPVGGWVMQDMIGRAIVDPFESEQNRSRLREEMEEQNAKRDDSWREVSKKLQKLIDQAYGRAHKQNEENPRPAGSVGGWRAGDNKQEHQAVRFEIEAERALHLGKPLPKDEGLRQMHLELNELHSAYQKTGDRALLIEIAELTAQYDAAKRERGAR